MTIVVDLGCKATKQTNKQNKFIWDIHVSISGHILSITQNIDSNHLWFTKKHNLGAQWLSGRVLDSKPRGGGFKLHRRHCIVVLEQDTFILA